MKFSDETLMAYVDRQLDPETRAQVEQAMATDAALARRVERHMALARDIRAAFDPVLREPVPARLLNTVAPDAAHGMAEIIDLAQRRPAPRVPSARRWSWPRWGAIAASIIAGVVVGRVSGPGIEQAQLVMTDGRVVAHGALAHALSTQLASTQPDNAPVRVGVSFVAKSGEYCRTFAFAQGAAGLACRTDGNWRLQVVAQSAAAASSGAYRRAESSMPPAVMLAVDAEIQGSPLDANDERSARQNGWRR